jgi:hypothetical protein
MGSQTCQSCKLEVDSTSLFTCPSCGNAYHSICWHNNNYQCSAPGCTGIYHDQQVIKPNRSRTKKWAILFLSLLMVGIFLICLLGAVLGYFVIIKKFTLDDFSNLIQINQSQSESINGITKVNISPSFQNSGNNNNNNNNSNATSKEFPLTTPIMEEPSIIQFITPTIGESIIFPSPTPSKLITPTLNLDLKGYKCPDKEQIQLSIGDNAIVGGIDINLRESPKVPEQWNANIIGVLKKGDRVKVLDGPVCAHDGSWWYVSTQSNEQGWTREMLPDKGYLIFPIAN